MILRTLRALAWAGGLALVQSGCATGGEMTHPTVLLDTSHGDIRIELLPEHAPVSTANFLSHVDRGFYDGLIFHRVIPGFMVQSGGHEIDFAERPGAGDMIVNESDNGLSNLRGTIAMARLPDPHTARSQFFINLMDNMNLDHGRRPGDWGYAVFGRVIEGMEVVDEIARQPTGSFGGRRDVPLEPIVIRTARRGPDLKVIPASPPD
ncbi:MAG: peptidylprolyl isomerase [Gemmatimonadota bacterium]|nr:peptidylprolyl isomerase [Gemmatimonadota bacterium]